MKIRPANKQDLAELISWLPTEIEAKNWGGPTINFPLNVEQLKNDIGWDIADSFSLIDRNGNLLGFAQTFNKYGYRHLSRIIISPKMRGKKLGYKLMETILNLSGTKGVDFSLLVYKDNTPAIHLYERCGFLVQTYPKMRAKVKNCIFMVKKI